MDDRLFAAHLRNGTLWTAHNIEVDNTGTASTSGNRNGSRWYAIQNLSGTPGVAQSGTVFDSSVTSNPKSYWIPTIMVSGQGHAAMGFSTAGANNYINAATCGRLTGDSGGTMQAPVEYTASSTAYNSPTSITLNLNTTGATTGARTVTVTNPDGQTATSGSVILNLAAAPNISSLNRANSDPSKAATVNWTLTFNSGVNGVTAANFSLTGSAAAGAAVGTPVTTNGGVSWNVPVTTGPLDGTLTLSLTLTVQASDSLATWTDLAQSTAGAPFVVLVSGATAAETGTGNMRQVTATDVYAVTDAAHPQRFMRLKITRE